MRKKIITASVLLASTLAVAMPVAAEEPHVAPIKEYVELDVKNWLSDPTIIAAIKAQNEKHASLSEEEIVALDNQWREQADADSKPMIDELLSRDVSKLLMEKQEASTGLISEAFIMDSKGLNVGQSAETSDYWQGDEDKWQKTYLVGPDAIFVDGVEVDDSSGALQSQVSLPITDPDSGDVIGAITLGINVDSL